MLLWKDYVFVRPAWSTTLTWGQFSQLFLHKFLPITLRENYRRQFDRIQQGSISVTQYGTRWSGPSCYSSASCREREGVRRFLRDSLNRSRYRWPRRLGMRFLFKQLLMFTGVSSWFLHRRKVKGLIRGLVILVGSVVPHLEAEVLLVEANLPGHFIQCSRHLALLQVVVALICLIPTR